METAESDETYSIKQIREAFAKHASTDGWGVRNFAEDGLIAALRGRYDDEPEPACTCGAVEYGPLAQHLDPCPLRMVTSPAVGQ